MDNIKRILVACKIPEQCREAIHHGITLSRLYGAELYVINITHHPFIRGEWNLPVQLGVIEDEYKKATVDAKKTLEAMIREEKKKGVSVKEIVKEGKPAEEILKVIKEEKIDLLIMMGHEETKLEHFLFGRINDEITRKMPCSIMMVKKEPQPA
ncbi:MAG TPA: universal stress protein [Candidatus Sulfobium mesophilum]|nr:universal stress protein [Candidatus Sulfobium mesophilum]